MDHLIGQEVEHRCASQANQSEIRVPELDGDWLNSTVVQYGQCAISVTHNVNGNVISTEYPCVYGMEYDAPSDISIVSEVMYTVIQSVGQLQGTTVSQSISWSSSCLNICISSCL